MPRQSRSRPSRAAASPPVQQQRGAHTAAAHPGTAPPLSPAPAAAPAAAATQSKEPGMFAQMAATAGSVAIGSTIGHGISSMLFGGSSSTPTQEAAAPPVQQQAYQSRESTCGFQMEEFEQCIKRSGNSVEACTYFFEQLKMCQSVAPSR